MVTAFVSSVMNLIKTALLCLQEARTELFATWFQEPKLGSELEVNGNIVASNCASGCAKEGVKVGNGKCAKNNPRARGNCNLLMQNMCAGNLDDSFEIEGKDNMFISNVAQDDKKMDSRSRERGITKPVAMPMMLLINKLKHKALAHDSE